MRIKRISIKGQVFDLIKEKILKKEYKLGEYINIQELTRQLSVSNTPIREALSSLEAEGLIELSDNSKYKVIDLSEKEIVDLNESILILLLGSLNLIRQKNRVAILEDLLEKAYLDHLKIYEMKKAFDYEYIKTSLNFDRQFVVATDNVYMGREFDSLVNLLLLTSIYNKSAYKDIHFEEHRLMFEAIKKRDFDEIENILKRHFNKKESDMDYS
ncbi:GntR family transcriptional regulator [Peptoniphilus catoniae]|uniref:GntR family transcriptional regulator n=1 Tax=Peptoniphilus catoniae TaxID=1660341 RepID=UPI0010FDD442|nr:GntR family transcriptional regulator [Peptoniphilus catoniae]